MSEENPKISDIKTDLEFHLKNGTSFTSTAALPQTCSPHAFRSDWKKREVNINILLQ
jgi:hypothetical protein